MIPQKSVPDLTPERDQLNPDQSHVYDLSLTIFLRDGEDFYWLIKLIGLSG